MSYHATDELLARQVSDAFLLNVPKLSHQEEHSDISSLCSDRKSVI